MVPGLVFPAAGFVPVVFFFVSGFLARNAPPPTSAPTSCAWATTAIETLKAKAAETNNAARSIALAPIITLLLLSGLLILRLTSAKASSPKNVWVN